MNSPCKALFSALRQFTTLRIAVGFFTCFIFYFLIISAVPQANRRGVSVVEQSHSPARLAAGAEAASAPEPPQGDQPGSGAQEVGEGGGDLGGGGAGVSEGALEHGPRPEANEARQHGAGLAAVAQLVPRGAADRAAETAAAAARGEALELQGRGGAADLARPV